MTRETRIGLLVGLMFIVLFGLVLSELTGTTSAPAKPVTTEVVKLLSIEGLPQVNLDHIDYVEDLSDFDVAKPAQSLAAKDVDKSPTNATAAALPVMPTASILVSPAPNQAATPVRIHTVSYGESLCKIAGKYY